MGKAILVVRTNPVDGREDEYNEWYTNKHVPDILALPGFVAARRYVLAEPDETAEFRYLAIYEVEGSVADALGALAGAGLDVSPSLDPHTSAEPYVAFDPTV
ncbi:DUF4286 family protein [Dactylosporangium sp. NPDC005572]|uniref:DUF4286 family protein n=1 Tax=Dactylosporangium sp. NPDC005572 TaxID=3156889 RepID=UPI0033A70442